MREVAEWHKLRVKNRDVQINVGVQQEGKNLLEFDIVEQGETNIVQTNDSTIKIVQAIQKGFCNSIEHHPEIARKGQESIAVTVDRKSRLKGALTETPYFASYDEDIHSEESSAFPVHRDNTGKSGMMRMVCVDKNGKVWVIEIRLIGNNTHIPYHDESIVSPIFNGIESLLEIILPYIAASLQELNLSLCGDETVIVNHSGSLPRINPMTINYTRGFGGIKSSVTGLIERQYAEHKIPEEKYYDPIEEGEDIL